MEPPEADQLLFVPLAIPAAFKASTCDKVKSLSSIIFDEIWISPDLSILTPLDDSAGIIESMKHSIIPIAIPFRMNRSSKWTFIKSTPLRALLQKWRADNDCSNFFPWRGNYHYLIARRHIRDVSHSNTCSVH